RAGDVLDLYAVSHFASFVLWLFFFFSSRRRHTRWPRDWSSDVCSSDLARDQSAAHGMAALAAPPATPRRAARARPHGPPRRDGAHPHVHGRGEASGGTALVLRLPSCDLRRALAGERRLSRRGAPGSARGVRRGPPRV